jgi:acetolactate synthase-1/2/3 large subunit
MNNEDREMKGSDLLVAALENEGVDRIFGVPGEENLDVVESLRKSSIELVVTRHEQPPPSWLRPTGASQGGPVSPSALWNPEP